MWHFRRRGRGLLLLSVSLSLYGPIIHPVFFFSALTWNCWSWCRLCSLVSPSSFNNSWIRFSPSSLKTRTQIVFSIAFTLCVFTFRIHPNNGATARQGGKKKRNENVTTAQVRGRDRRRNNTHKLMYTKSSPTANKQTNTDENNGRNHNNIIIIIIIIITAKTSNIKRGVPKQRTRLFF